MSARNLRRRDCTYRSNGPPPYHMRFGPRAMCGQSGFPTYRDKLVEDEWGLPVDPDIPGTYDTKEQEDGRSR